MKKLIFSLILLLSPIAANAGRFSWVCQDPFSETTVNMKERDIDRVKRTGNGRNLDLGGANLKSTNLEGADLRGASLRESLEDDSLKHIASAITHVCLAFYAIKSAEYAKADAKSLDDAITKAVELKLKEQQQKQSHEANMEKIKENFIRNQTM